MTTRKDHAADLWAHRMMFYIGALGGMIVVLALWDSWWALTLPATWIVVYSGWFIWKLRPTPQEKPA
jgi:hypothetical protein